jgi:hypothetical protein
MTPDLFAEYRELPPGPAWIPLTRWEHRRVPPGYTFQPATDHTGAGWVRPHGVR